MTVYRINKQERDYTFRDKFQDRWMDKAFREIIEEIKPDICHFGHLSHLSTNLVNIAKEYKIPVVYTLHDYWLMCIKGQLITPDQNLCSNPNPEACYRCNEKYFTKKKTGIQETELWFRSMKRIIDNIDIFIAPSNFLRQKYIEFGIPPQKIIYQDYGFNKRLFEGFKHLPSEKIRFGFLGRLIPVKGVQDLIDSFNLIKDNRTELSIYGNNAASISFLKDRVTNHNIIFKGSYKNDEISDVLSKLDVIVVPSKWYENSPLTIHEAFIANIPVITSNLGGMAELVQDGVNGLLFKTGDVKDLRDKINRFIDEPDLILKLTRNKTSVRSIQQDVQEITEIYNALLNKEEN